MTTFDVTLSFDNGPEPDVTPIVLDVLARTGVKSTFFVLGEKLAMSGRRALTERAAAEGHWVGNHTYTHSIPLGECTAADTAQMEIGRTEALIGDLAHPDKFFRPFGGGGHIGPHLLSPAVVGFLKNGGYSCVLWNSIPRDWEDTEHWPVTALQQCRSQPWSLVVVHDLPTGAMNHLERFIDDVRADGGQFRQDFPADCMPIRNGEETMPLTPYTASTRTSASAMQT